MRRMGSEIVIAEDFGTRLQDFQDSRPNNKKAGVVTNDSWRHPLSKSCSRVFNDASNFANEAIKNNGKEADQLLGAKGDVSSSVEIHEMQLENNVMKMRAVPEVQLPVGYEVTFKHGQANGYHLMLIDLKKPLKQGDKFELTLNFKKAGDCQAEFWVEAPKSDSHKH